MLKQSIQILCIIIFSEICFAQISFKKKEIIIYDKKIKVEIAETTQQHELGLMYRKKLEENEGMLFIFSQQTTLSFWMKNTYLDLAIGYFDKNKTLVDIQEMNAIPPGSKEIPTTYPSSKPAMYALEVNKGWFTKNKVKLGSKFKFH